MKRYAPAAVRNSEPIAEVLAQELPADGLVLEIASGTGQHAVFFARHFPHLRWQPSDADPSALESIQAWRLEDGSGNILPPVTLDAQLEAWPILQASAIVCVNMVHISPWAATAGLFAGAAGLLPPAGPLILYGPFIENAVPTASSNLAFDASLKEQDAAWGLRDLANIDALGHQHSLTRTARHVEKKLRWRRTTENRSNQNIHIFSTQNKRAEGHRRA